MDGQRKRQYTDLLLSKKNQNVRGKWSNKYILFRNYCNRAKDTSVENRAQFQAQHRIVGFKAKEQGVGQGMENCSEKAWGRAGYWFNRRNRILVEGRPG